MPQAAGGWPVASGTVSEPAATDLVGAAARPGTGRAPATAGDPAMDAALARVTGSLAAHEDRPSQRAMAAAVGRAVTGRRHLVVQAGTGTGKSLGYLVPTLVLGARVVVSTATKALQDQLATRDLPLLERSLGVPFTWAVLKGRSNYLCRQRASEVAGAGDQLPLAASQPAAPAAPLPPADLQLAMDGGDPPPAGATAAGATTAGATTAGATTAGATTAGGPAGRRGSRQRSAARPGGERRGDQARAGGRRRPRPPRSGDPPAGRVGRDGRGPATGPS